ncbi:MAG: cysteine desulfurase-like protein [Actinomycetota bacterium]|nr:cysteine desulfurase-like protein [Actinomycetota bacterium]
MTGPDLSALRERFPALARRGPDGRRFVWADCPGGSQVPDTVIEAVAGRLRQGLSNTHGAFVTSRETDDIIADARRAAADVTGADPGEIVFGPNSTSLLLSLSRAFARTLRPGDEIVVTVLDHDANVRPWMLAAEDAGATVRWVDVCPDDVTLDRDALEATLTDRTRLVAFTLASNAVGTIPPAADLIRRIHEAGALVAVDGVHLAQHRALDLKALGADVLACSPYKFFGPHLGILAVRRELLDMWAPYKLRPARDQSPDRWETGTQDHEALAGLVAAADYLAGIGEVHAAPADGSRRAAIVAAFDAIEIHERALALRFLDGLDRLPNVELFGIADRPRVEERTPTFAVRVGDLHPTDVAAELGRRGIFVWDGHYYAITLMERLGLQDTGGAVRIGFCHYHSNDEVDRVLEALAELTR